MKKNRRNIIILFCILVIIRIVCYSIEYRYRSKLEKINLQEGKSSYFISYNLGFSQVMDDGLIYEYGYDEDEAMNLISPSSPIIYIGENRTQKAKQRQLLIYENGDIYVDDSLEYKGEKIGNIENAISGTISSKHIAIVTETGDLYVYGSNLNGELGIPKIEATYEFTLVKDMPKVKKVICQDNYTFILSEEGKVYGCGLWFGEYTSKFTIYKTKSIITDIGCTFQTVVALDDKGYVYELGYTDFLEHGLDVNNDFKKVKGLNNIIEISIGHHYTVVLNKKRNVYYWGARNVRKASGEHFLKKVFAIKNADNIYSGSAYFYVIKDNIAYKILFNP